MPKNPDLFTAADELAQVLGPDLAKAFLDHRKALKKPMTPYAGQLMAKKLRGMPDPVAAVEQSILKGWTDVYPVEVQTARTSINGRRMTAAEITGENLRREIAELQGQGGEEGGDLFGPGRVLAISRQAH